MSNLTNGSTRLGSLAGYPSHARLAAKPLTGFKGSGVLEVIDDYDGDTYRTVYTVQFANVVYVLHAFQKKSKRGIETPKRDVDLVKSRLAIAKELYEEREDSKRGR